MRTSRIKIFLILILLVLCLSAGGCTESKSYSETAAELFGQGEYDEAERFFLAALASEEASDTVRLGHAYNQIALGQNANALDELILIQDSFEDNAVKVSIRKTILDIYLKDGNNAGTARVCEELSRLVTDENEADNYLLEAAGIRADIYREQGETDKLEEELKKIISLKVYAGEEYIELYSMYAERDEREPRLELADEIIAYMTGHSAYISDYRQVIAVIFDAADLAGYTEGKRSTEDYFVEAENFIAKAENAGLSENDTLKYKVIIAERRGKLDLAYRLLGVYLNHCPDDAAAIKELDYLENRLGITDDQNR